MCDRIFPRSMRHCTRDPVYHLVVEATGEEIELCEPCGQIYMNNLPVTYTPRRPTHAPSNRHEQR